MIFYTTALVLLVGITIGCEPAVSRQSRSAAAGVMDLSHWDFADDGPVALRGEWEFSWKRFLDPEESANSGVSDAPSYIKTPGYWNDFPFRGEPVGSLGFATYRLRILLPEEAGRMAIRVKDIQTAYILYLDGSPVLSNGSVGTNAGESVPDYEISIFEFQPKEPEILLMLHVSNFHFRYGGMWELIEIGRDIDIRRHHENVITTDIFLVGIIIAMGLYHIMRYLIRRDDLMSLYFGLFCTLVAIRALTVGNLLAYRIFSGLSWGVLHKVEYFSFYLSIPIFLAYLNALFSSESRQVFLKISIGLAAVFILVVAITPPLIYGRMLISYQVITLLACIYSLYVLIKAVRNRREGARIILSGFLFLFLIVINDILYSNQLIHTGHLMPWGQIIFLLSQDFLIARISARTHRSLVQSNSLLAESRVGLILGLAKLAEFRDEDTGIHLERIREYSRILAKHLSVLPAYRGYITDEYIEDLYHSSILHDIGKVGVSDAVLLKPGKLNPDEFELIKRHARLGGDAIRNVEAGMKVQSFLTLGIQIAYSHHEKWDGSGYPEGLKGEAIPLSARIVALADVYDALTSKRPYKVAFSHEKAREIILEGRATHFDPVIVDAFLDNETVFMSIRKELDSPDLIPISPSEPS